MSEVLQTVITSYYWPVAWARRNGIQNTVNGNSEGCVKQNKICRKSTQTTAIQQCAMETIRNDQETGCIFTLPHELQTICRNTTIQNINKVCVLQPNMLYKMRIKGVCTVFPQKHSITLVENSNSTEIILVGCITCACPFGKLSKIFKAWNKWNRLMQFIVQPTRCSESDEEEKASQCYTDKIFMRVFLHLALPPLPTEYIQTRLELLEKRTIVGFILLCISCCSPCGNLHNRCPILDGKS